MHRMWPDCTADLRERRSEPPPAGLPHQEENGDDRKHPVHDKHGYHQPATPTIPAKPINDSAMIPEVMTTIPGPRSPLGMSAISRSRSWMAAMITIPRG